MPLCKPLLEVALGCLWAPAWVFAVVYEFQGPDVVNTHKHSNLGIIICAVILCLVLPAHLLVLASGQDSSLPPSPLPLILLFIEFLVVVVLIVFAWKAGQAAKASASEVRKALETVGSYMKDDRKHKASDSRIHVDCGLAQLLNELGLQLSEYRRTARELIDRAVDVICVIDFSGQIATVNPACKSAWGYTQDELEGQPLTKLFETDEANRIMSSVLGASRSIDKIVFESRLRRKDGELVDVIWTGHWSARERGFFCIVHDVSQQKQLERMKAEFIAMVTHDIRAPLATVEGVLSLMEQGVLGEMSDKGKKIAQGTRKECGRLLRLLNDMLQLEKIEAGSFDLECSQIDLATVAADAIESAGSFAEGRGVKLELSCASAACWGDEIRISQVLLNLLSNAIKYTPEQSVVCVIVEKRPGSAYIAVRDYGRGIPREKIEKIFDKFEQVSSADAREKQGTGLGLAICKAIISQHGGEIGVESEIGKGSTFWFSIPDKSGVDSSKTLAGTTPDPAPAR
ncbi:MAG TPA: PAS domain-containing sensor histidine kinase [Candidatus Obscuribacterales bacterium]